MQLRALGLLGKLLSGPLMQRFYAKKDHLANLEIIPIVKSCIQTLMALGNSQYWHSRLRWMQWVVSNHGEQPLLTLRAEMDAMGGKPVFSNHFHLELKRSVSVGYLKSKSRSQCKYSKSNLRHTWLVTCRILLQINSPRPSPLQYTISWQSKYLA